MPPPLSCVCSNNDAISGSCPHPVPGDRRVRVLLPLPLAAGAYDYLLADGMDAGLGDFVRVPLGRRRLVGVIWDTSPADPPPDARLRRIEERLPAPPLPPESRHFIDWLAAYVLAPPGAVLRMAMSVPRALEPEAPRTGWLPVQPLPAIRRSAARDRVLAFLSDGRARSLTDLTTAAGVGSGVVRGLAAAGALRTVALPGGSDWPLPDLERPGPTLSAEQTAAAEALRAAVGRFGVQVLDGVTGSGKTEVYFEAMAAALAAGHQVLVLVPEIALSAPWLDRFQARFGTAPAAWHSDLGTVRRGRVWRAVADGAARVVVGARSALHLPFPKLGLIVVDEEHDPSFKQEEGVIYHARDMAVVRGKLADCPVILASATPSLESMANIRAGRYGHLVLPRRHGGASLPSVEAVDMRAHAPGRAGWISPPLRERLAATVQAGEQALLFLNRRGYAPLSLCRACGHRMNCPACTAWLVEHRARRRLECHHCGYHLPYPASCPECAAAGSLHPCGPGVERLAEEAGALFPDARIAMVTAELLNGPAAAAGFVRRMLAGEVDILIGTQIVAKGHHFPQLTLVGVIDADLGLAGGDLRAAERTYQLLAQVAGRAGRATRPGHIMIQTCCPESDVMQALIRGDRDGFLAAEAEKRRPESWPPFGRLAALILAGRQEAAVERAARDLARSAPTLPGLRVLGPATPALALLRGRHRRRLLVKAGRGINLQRILRDWLRELRLPSSVRLKIDIDPQSFA